MKRLSAEAIIVCFVSIAAMSAGEGCGLFNAGSGVWIDLPDQNVTFDLDIGSVKEAFKEWLDSQGSPYNTIDPNNVSEIPDGITINQTFPIEVVLQHIDLSGNSTIKAYVDSGKIKAVGIRYVTYNLTSAPNVDLPAFDFYMDTFEASVIDPAKKVATLPVIEAGQTGTGEVVFAEGGREKMSDYFLELKFTILAKATITIDTSVDRTIPDGSLTGLLTMGVKFKVDPL